MKTIRDIAKTLNVPIESLDPRQRPRPTLKAIKGGKVDKRKKED